MMSPTITLTGDKLVVKFGGYDPDAVARIRDVPGRRWNPDKKAWMIPIASRMELQRAFPMAMLPIIDEPARPASGPIAIDYAGYAPETTPYEFQRLGASMLSQWGGAIFDECGTGKSRQALDAFGILKSKGEAIRMLIICPMSLMRNWADEVQKHTRFSYFLIDADRPNIAKRPWTSNLEQKPVDASVKGHVMAHDISVINYDKIRIKRFYDLIHQLIAGGCVDVICCDEAHRIKNRGAKQTKAVTSLHAKHCWALTATPLANRPEEIQPLGDWVTHDRAFGGWGRFNAKYCTWGKVQVKKDWIDRKTGKITPARFINAIVGYKNQPELRGVISRFSVRRMKADVLDLPPKAFSHRHFAMTPAQERAYDQMKLDFIAWLEKRDGSERPLTAKIVLSQLIRLNQIASNLYIVGGTDEGGKFDGLLDLADDLIYNEHKIVVWSHWVQGVVLAHKRLSEKFTGVMMHGEVPAAQRHELKTRFQEDPETKYFVGNPDCAGLGIDLYAADTEIVIDSGYSYVSYMQMVDRCHRIGQKNPVSIVNMLSTYRDGRPTVDELVFKKLRAKAEMAGGLLGDPSNPFGDITTQELLKVLQ